MTAPVGKVLHVQKVAGISGSEAHLLQLLPGLRERGWDVDFLMLHEDEPGAWEFARELHDRGVPLDDVRLRADVDPIAYAEVAAFLARRRPRILHTHLVHADVYGQIAGAMARTSASSSPPSTASTGSVKDASSGSPIAPSRRWPTSTSRSRRVSPATSPRWRDSTRTASRSSTTESLRETACTPFAGSEPRLLCVGRLIPVKGHLVLLRALAQARARVPDLVLDIAGSGPLEPALRGYARELGLGGAVRFLGFVSPVQKAIEDASVVVVPSLGEGFGMVALEAMERARPVIASAVGGLPEIVADGETGLVVPPGAAEALADAMVALASDLPRAAAMGEAGRRRALDSFTQERSTAAIEALYRRELERASS